MLGRRPFFGWYVVLGAFTVALFGWGFGFYGLAVYLAELQRLRGWSPALIGSCATAYYLAGAALLAGYHGVAARFGQRAVTLAGIAAMATAVVALAAVREPWQLLAAYLLMAVGWATMSLTAVTAFVAPWFERRRGLALSLALNGASCGGIVLAPALIWLTRLLGLQAALSIAAAVMVVILVPLVVRCLGRTPRALGLHADGDPAPAAVDLGVTPAPTRRALLRRFDFWMVAIPFALALLAQVGFITHQVAFLTPRLGAGGAATALALTTAAAVAGRIGLGLVVDRFDPRATTAGCLLSQALALVLMTSAPTPALLYVGCVIFGLSVGNLITLPALVVQRVFAETQFVAAVGLIAAVSQIFYAFGPGLLGVVYTATGAYTVPLLLCVGLELAAAALLVLPGGRAAQRAPPAGLR